MEASFKCRVNETFAFLGDGAKADTSKLWSVGETAAIKDRRDYGKSREEDIGSDYDDQSGYDRFLNVENIRRGEYLSQGGNRGSRFFGEEDLEDLESDEDEDEDEDGDEEDEEETRRVGKRKKGGGGQSGTTSSTRGLGEEGEEGAGRLQAASGQKKNEDSDDEAREVREMVGMDETLDFEDEEDEYDKVAAGTEGSGDRLYMGQIQGFQASRLHLNPLPTSFSEMRQASRDMRADHRAALARLEEDDREAVAKSPSTAHIENRTGEQDSTCGATEDSNMADDRPIGQDFQGETMDIDANGTHKEEALAETGDRDQHPVAGRIEPCRVSDGKPRKSGKRVRFSIDENAGNESTAGRSDERDLLSRLPQGRIVMDVSSESERRFAAPATDRYRKVPDYVKNPSKYIQYTLDWAEEDEEQQNLAAFHSLKGATSLTQDMITDKQEEDSSMENQVASEGMKISFNPIVARSGAGKHKSLKRSVNVSRTIVTEEHEEVGPHTLTAVRTTGVVNIAASFDVDCVLGMQNNLEDDQDISTFSEQTGEGRLSRGSRRYRSTRQASDESTEE